MQVSRTRRFVVEHLLVSSVAFAVVVSSLTLALTLAVTNDFFGLEIGSTDAVAGANTEVNLPTDRQAIGAAEAVAPRTMDRADMNSALRDGGTQASTRSAGETTVPRVMDHADMISAHQASSGQASEKNAAGWDTLDGELGPYWLNSDWASTALPPPNVFGPIP